ncbi:MAG TPA: hypothetical protein DEQ64_07720 [Lachnoclostridium sp.]|nr:hypothetical protein [Lachnoclostridium sp.]
MLFHKDPFPLPVSFILWNHNMLSQIRQPFILSKRQEMQVIRWAENDRKAAAGTHGQPRLF